MSFTREIKRELIKSAPKKRCCKLSLLSAVLKTSGTCKLGTGGSFSFTSENEEISAYLLGLAEQLFGVQMTLTSVTRDPKHGRDKLTFSYDGKDAEVFSAEIASYGESLEQEECCRREYLKGALLGSGSCTLPREGTKTGYHLEFIFQNYDDALKFQALLDDFQLFGNIVSRGEKFLVYLKSREGIADFLAIIGAEAALSTLEKVSSAREESNNENRKSNCYAGNADKAAIASAEQVLAFEKMKAEGVFTYLSPSLKAAAQARLENPELSLSELAEKLSVTKSCLNHRMRKLMEIYRTEVKT